MLLIFLYYWHNINEISLIGGVNVIRIKDIEEYIDDTMLETIFRQREENIYNNNKMASEQITEITEEYTVDYEKLIIAIKNLPPHFHNTREGILEKLEEYPKRENQIMAYDDKKFYKIRILRWN